MIFFQACIEREGRLVRDRRLWIAKRINQAVERPSPSTSLQVNGKGKGTVTASAHSVKQPHDHRDSHSASLSKNNMNQTQTVKKNLMSVVQTPHGYLGSAILRGTSSSVRVDDDYIQDDFNLCGLSSVVPYYEYALDLILDVESSHGEMFTEEQNELIESAAEMLYGLIHARYILTTKDKYKNYDFGRCPRVYCCGQPCLPVGQSDLPRSSTVKIYCPKCQDIYYPRSKYQGNIDGAYFGTTFPHLFLMTYGNLKPPKATQNYVPRVFGFKLHKP
ncbi:hypothetical protein HID58_006340 [Brassica napus]|uniref:Casein kinase II subunit beta n=1 Tax=Brassica napus TaxID=3708 RepID=A0ABQ8EB66_BRANA|nr:hypothetical protein HID58_006340 [Brassica napus]